MVNSAIALVFLPFIVLLTRRFPVERRHWVRALIVHVPACLAFSVAHSWLYYAVCYASHDLGQTLFFRFQPNLLTYWAIVGFTQAVDYFRRYTERERELSAAQLLLLKSQLQPHFLFNALHTISAMMHEDVGAADRTIQRLSELLRMTLETIGTQETPLQHEVEFLKKYLELQQTRFPGRFELRLEIDPAVLDALVPSMLLQPLVENSIRHGFDLSRGNWLVTVAAQRAGARLKIEVTDNGRGAATSSLPEGLGLGNTRERLRHLYGGDQRFEVHGDPGAGFAVSITIPFRLAAVPQESPLMDFYDDSRVGSRRRSLGPEAHHVTPEK